jgi:hypothetical protein
MLNKSTVKDVYVTDFISVMGGLTGCDGLDIKICREKKTTLETTHMLMDNLLTCMLLVGMKMTLLTM